MVRIILCAAAILLASILFCTAPSPAQTCTPTPSTTITTESGSFEVHYFKDGIFIGQNVGSILRFATKGLSFEVEYFMERGNVGEPITFNISNGQNPMNWDQGSVRFDVRGQRLDQPIDFAQFMPEPYRSLWIDCGASIAQFFDHQELRDFIVGESSEEEYSFAMNALRDLKDGYYIPNVYFDNLFGPRFVMGQNYWMSNPVFMVGYTLYGKDIQLDVEICDIGLGNDQDFYLTINGTMPEDRWYFLLDFESETIQTTWAAGDPIENPFDEGTVDVKLLYEIIPTFEFYKDSIPIAEQHGILDANDGLLSQLINESLNRLYSYRIEIVYRE